MIKIYIRIETKYLKNKLIKNINKLAQ